MVHTVFTWRYGGRQVFLCGSFSGWTEHIQMILMEGSSMIFQTIQDLPPGYHQYKFLVDGVRLFDPQQLCVHDEYGAIINFVHINEPASSSTLHPERVLPSSDNMIDVSRRHLFMHLESFKTFELIPNSGKVIALDANVAMEQACHVMYEEGLAVVPIWDGCSKQMLGMLTASDFILILMEFQRSRPRLSNEQLEMHSISAWKEGKLQLRREAVGATQLLYRRPLIQAGPDESLRDVALRILQNKISTVPVIDSMQDGSCSKLLHIACLSGILKYICRHLRHRLEILPLLQQPIGSLPLGTWREDGSNGRVLVTLRPIDPLSSALKILIEGQISSVPIVDDKGALINVYSRSDITSLSRDNVYTRIQLDQTMMSQALELLDVANRSRYQICTRSDSLYRVMEFLSDPVVRRVIVIDAGIQRVEGIITLSDVFNFILV